VREDRREGREREGRAEPRVGAGIRNVLWNVLECFWGKIGMFWGVLECFWVKLERFMECFEYFGMFYGRKIGMF
jgi:hypothetical protein